MGYTKQQRNQLIARLETALQSVLAGYEIYEGIDNNGVFTDLDAAMSHVDFEHLEKAIADLKKLPPSMK